MNFAQSVCVVLFLYLGLQYCQLDPHDLLVKTLPQLLKHVFLETCLLFASTIITVGDCFLARLLVSGNSVDNP